MAKHSMEAHLKWYIEHRLEYLYHQQEELLQTLKVDSFHEKEYDALKKYFENSGRIRELKQLSERINKL